MKTTTQDDGGGTKTRPGKASNSLPSLGNSNGNGLDHATEWDPFTNVYGDVLGPDAEIKGNWQLDLPTVDEVKIKATSIYSPAKLRALSELRTISQEDYLDLVHQLVAAAADAAVTVAKIRAAGEEQSRKDRQMLKATAADDTDGDKETVLDALIRLGQKNTELSHAPNRMPYATVTENGRRKTLRITSGTFMERLINLHLQETGRAVSIDVLKAAVMTLAALAKRDTAPTRPVFPRVGAHGGNLYLDRGSDKFDAIEIKPAERLNDGSFRPVWSVIAEPPIAFIRPEGAPIGELPVPRTRGERERDQHQGIEALLPYLAVPDRDNFILCSAWIIGCFSIAGDKAVAVLTGEGGSGKTSTGRVMCAVVDPLPPPQDADDDSDDRRGHMRALPSDPKDGQLAAQTTWIQPYDNISRISEEQANFFCRVSTGGLDRGRQFYSQLDEIALSARRPVMITAVEDLVLRDDLASRCLFIRCERAADVEMADEVSLWQKFEAEWPAILGAVLDAISTGLANHIPDLPNLPRMARFINWMRRCEPGFNWPADTFVDAYRRNQVAGAEIVADADPVITAVRDFATQQIKAGKLDWSGTPTKLYENLSGLVGYAAQRARAWPKRPAELSKKLRSSVTMLSKLGIAVSSLPRTAEGAQVALTWPPSPLRAENVSDPCSNVGVLESLTYSEGIENNEENLTHVSNVGGVNVILSRGKKEKGEGIGARGENTGLAAGRRRVVRI